MIEFISVVLALFTLRFSGLKALSKITVEPWIRLSQAAPCQSRPQAPWEPQWLPMPVAASSAAGRRLALGVLLAQIWPSWLDHLSTLVPHSQPVICMHKPLVSMTASQPAGDTGGAVEANQSIPVCCHSEKGARGADQCCWTDGSPAASSLVVQPPAGCCPWQPGPARSLAWSACCWPRHPERWSCCCSRGRCAWAEGRAGRSPRKAPCSWPVRLHSNQPKRLPQHARDSTAAIGWLQSQAPTI